MSCTGTTTVTINSDTGGPFAIITNGPGGDGIYAYAPGAVTITHSGDIISNDARGIYATSDTDTVDVNFTGTLNASDIGIYAKADQAASVTSTGDVTTEGAGLVAEGYVSAMVSSTGGNITTSGVLAYGIAAFSGGNVSVTMSGNITTQGDGANGILVLFLRRTRQRQSDRQHHHQRCSGPRHRCH